ncbi:hypothetical protein Salat_1172300 [Sesamum alatum]|uniref:CCHC-type domain-containing protein n=1 Tax=Sesamum alatum TaxID=300844 RepID=A0AAE1YEJ9_9LAMI|nr:hypothetical protein Salat_1172300 [Sesamum alatum]
MEEEDDCIVLPNTIPSSPITLDLTLVGQLLSHRSTNFDALTRTFFMLLSPAKGVNIRRVAENHYCFVFNHIVDLRHTLSLRPWTFDRNLLIIQPLSLGMAPEEVSLDWSPFFVRVHGIPYGLRSSDTARMIGSKIGRWEDETNVQDSITWQDSLRIRICLDVTVPLKRALRVRVANRTLVVVHFTYERLPNFCYLCGRLGHIQRICDLRFTDDFVDPGSHAPYGPWLRENPFSSRSTLEYSSVRPTVVRPFRSAHPLEVSNSDIGGSRRPARGLNIFGNFSPVQQHVATIGTVGAVVFSGPNNHVSAYKDILNPLTGGPTLPGGPNMDSCTAPILDRLSPRPDWQSKPTTSLGVSQMFTHSGHYPSSSSRILLPDLPNSPPLGVVPSGWNHVWEVGEGLDSSAPSAIPPPCRRSAPKIAADLTFSSSPVVVAERRRDPADRLGVVFQVSNRSFPSQLLALLVHDTLDVIIGKPPLLFGVVLIARLGTEHGECYFPLLRTYGISRPTLVTLLARCSGCFHVT